MLKNVLSAIGALCICVALLLLALASREKPKPLPLEAVVVAKAAEVDASTPAPAPAAPIPHVTTLAAEPPLPPSLPPMDLPPVFETPEVEAARVLDGIGNPSMPVAMKTAADLLRLIPGAPEASSLTPQQILAIEEAMSDANRRVEDRNVERDVILNQMADEHDLRNEGEDLKGRDQKVRLDGRQRFVFSREANGKMRVYTFLESDHPELFALEIDYRRQVSERLLSEAIAAVREGRGE